MNVRCACMLVQKDCSCMFVTLAVVCVVTLRVRVIFDPKLTFVPHRNTVLFLFQDLEIYFQTQIFVIISHANCFLMHQFDPSLQHASVVWPPIYNILRTNLKNVQRQYLKAEPKDSIVLYCLFKMNKKLIV